MRRAIILAFALVAAGCASDPYYAGYSGYSTHSYGTPYYSYGYGTPYYYDVYPGTIGGSIYYYRHDDGRDHWRHRDRDRDHDRNWRGRDPGDRGRGEGPRRPDRGPNLHGEAGNEAGM